MRQSEINTARSCIKKVMSHPVARFFQEYRLRGHYRIPEITLGGIDEKLAAKQYQSTSEWLQDVEKCWNSVENFYQDEVHLAVANECRRIFEAACRTSGLYPLKTWAEDVVDLFSRYKKKVKTVPSRYRHALHVSDYKDRKKHSEEALIKLASKLEKIEDPLKLLDISEVLIDSEGLKVNRDTDMWINLKVLKPSTLDKLQKFEEDDLSNGE